MVRLSLAAVLVCVVSAVTAEAQVLLTWKWREGELFWVERKMDKLVTSTTDKDRESAEHHRDIVCRCLVLKADADGGAVLEVSFEKVQTRSVGRSIEEPLKPLEGQVIQMTLDRERKAVKVEGVEGLGRVLFSDTPPEARKQVVERVQEGVKSWVEGMFLALPAGPVKSGDSWQNKGEYTIPAQGKWQTVTTLSYQGPKEHRGRTLHGINLSTKSSVTPVAAPASATLRCEKTEIKTDEDTGGAWFDAERGRLVQVTGKSRMVYVCHLINGAEKEVGENEISILWSTRYLDSSPLAGTVMPRPPFDPAERLAREDARLTRRLTNTLGQTLLLIPRGKFIMGSPRTEPGRWSFEDEHEVELTRPYYLSAHEVTVGQFRKFVADTGYRTEAEQNYFGGHGFDAQAREMMDGPKFNWRQTGFEQGDDHPVVNVSWNDAVKFCEWLSLKEKRKYRLPTEAEWEYACRAGTTTRFTCGEDTRRLIEIANCADEAVRTVFPRWQAVLGKDGHVFTAPVGKFKPNGWGLHDMNGNVLEWCQDWLEALTHEPARDPQGPALGMKRVLRGGSWADFASDMRSARRAGFPPSCRYALAGFRVLMEP